MRGRTATGWPTSRFSVVHWDRLAAHEDPELSSPLFHPARHLAPSGEAMVSALVSPDGTWRTSRPPRGRWTERHSM